MNGVSAYLGSQSGKESLIERILFAYAFFVLKQEWYTFCSVNIWNYSSAWGRNYKIRPPARSLDGGHLPPSVYLCRHWHHSHDKCSRTSHSIFAYCKQSKTGRWEGLGTKLQDTYTSSYSFSEYPSVPTCSEKWLPIVHIKNLPASSKYHTHKYLGISECMKAICT